MKAGVWVDGTASIMSEEARLESMGHGEGLRSVFGRASDCVSGMRPLLDSIGFRVRRGRSRGQWRAQELQQDRRAFRSGELGRGRFAIRTVQAQGRTGLLHNARFW